MRPYLDCVGLLVYSPVATLRPDNRVMYWGYNPGQDPSIKDETHWTIREAIEKFPRQVSLINEQSWPKPRKEKNTVTGEEKYSGRYPKGEAPYQRGVRSLLQFIGHTDAPVANFLFSRRAASITYIRRGRRSIAVGKFTGSYWKRPKLVY